MDNMKQMESLKAMEKFVVTALEQNAKDKKKGRELWMLLPAEWKGGVVASVAWANSFIDKNESLGKMDHSYYIDQVKENAESWFDFPERIKTEFTIFREIVHLIEGLFVDEFDEMPFEILYGFTRNQLHDRELWRNLFKCNDNNDILIENFFYNEAYEDILSDREIMREAITRNYSNAEFVTGQLCQDKSFWESLFYEESLEIFFHLPREVCRDLPHLIHDTLKTNPNIASFGPTSSTISYFGTKLTGFESVADEFDNPSFVNTWLEAGLPFLSTIMYRDADIYLLLARYCKNIEWKEFSFKTLPEKLRSDKEFFMKVVADSPDLLHAASEELQRDIDLAALACSKSSDALDHDPDLKIEMKHKFEELLLQYKAYNIFQNLLKYSSNETSDHCPMTLLPKDESFVQRLDADIASFVGVPNITTISMKIQLFASAIQHMDNH